MDTEKLSPKKHEELASKTKPARNLTVSYVDYPYPYGNSEPFYRLELDGVHVDIASRNLNEFLRLFGVRDDEYLSDGLQWIRWV